MGSSRPPCELLSGRPNAIPIRYREQRPGWTARCAHPERGHQGTKRAFGQRDRPLAETLYQPITMFDSIALRAD